MLRTGLILIISMLVLAGCKATKEPLTKVVTTVEYKTVYMPIRCQAKQPQKPVYSKEYPHTAGEVMKYYEIVESRFLYCIGVNTFLDFNITGGTK